MTLLSLAMLHSTGEQKLRKRRKMIRKSLRKVLRVELEAVILNLLKLNLILMNQAEFLFLLPIEIVK